MGKIKVLVIDDSVLIRHLLTDIINQAPDMEVVGAAPDPLIAREMIRTLNPDVLTLDVEMPKMDGLDFLERLMRLRPMPVVMVSTLTERGAEVTMKALELGAVDFVSKPKIGVADGLRQLGDDITEKIRAATKARVHRLAAAPATPAGPGAAKPAAVSPLGRLSTEKIIFIGASTGGTEATAAQLDEWIQAEPVRAWRFVAHREAPHTPVSEALQNARQWLTSDQFDAVIRAMPGDALRFVAEGMTPVQIDACTRAEPAGAARAQRLRPAPPEPALSRRPARPAPGRC